MQSGGAKELHRNQKPGRHVIGEHYCFADPMVEVGVIIPTGKRIVQRRRRLLIFIQLRIVGCLQKWPIRMKQIKADTFFAAKGYVVVNGTRIKFPLCKNIFQCLCVLWTQSIHQEYA